MSSLPEDILNRIALNYPHLPQKEEAIAGAILLLNKGCDAQIIRALLVLAQGKIEDFRYYLNCGLMSPEDLVLWAEYDRAMTRVYDLTRPFSGPYLSACEPGGEADPFTA